MISKHISVRRESRSLWLNCFAKLEIVGYDFFNSITHIWFSSWNCWLDFLGLDWFLSYNALAPRALETWIAIFEAQLRVIYPPLKFSINLQAWDHQNALLQAHLPASDRIRRLHPLLSRLLVLFGLHNGESDQGGAHYQQRGVVRCQQSTQIDYNRLWWLSQFLIDFQSCYSIKRYSSFRFFISPGSAHWPFCSPSPMDVLRCSKGLPNTWRLYVYICISMYLSMAY